MEVIVSGKGVKYPAEVNENFQLKTDGVIQRDELFIAEEFGQTYVITTNAVTLNSTNQHFLLYIKNNNSLKKLYNATIEVGYNGGSTNHNRCMILQILAGFIGPTANHQVASFNNVNFSSGNVAEATGYIWDGVGDGMTFTGGIVVNEGIMAKGHQVYETHGMPIMDFSRYLGIAVIAEEIGTVSITIRLFFK